jgi:Septum formation
LKPGDCIASSNFQLNNVNAPWPATLPVVPCSQKHIAEVYYASNYWATAATYPGDQVRNDQYNAECTKALNVYTKTNEYSYTGLAPDSTSWSSGDRRLVCVAYNATSEYPGGAPLYASIKAK